MKNPKPITSFTLPSVLVFIWFPTTFAMGIQNRDHTMMQFHTKSLHSTSQNVDAALPLGNYAWMNAGQQSTTALHAAFQQWESAVQSAKWYVDSEGSFTSQPSIIVPDIILSKKNESCGTCQCSFINRISLPANCDIEANSRLMAVKWIPKNATVLEVGARYGSVSCAISRILGESGKQVSMDADERVWEALELNRANLKCNFHIGKGLLGKHDGKIFQNRYGTLASTGSSFNGNAVATVPHFTVDDLEKTYNLKFDTANFDCEGCFAPVLEAFPTLFEQLKLLIVEVHDEPEAQAVAELQKRGWQMLGAHSRQRVLKNPRAHGVQGNLRKTS